MMMMMMMMMMMLMILCMLLLLMMMMMIMLNMMRMMMRMLLMMRRMIVLVGSPDAQRRCGDAQYGMQVTSVTHRSVGGSSTNEHPLDPGCQTGVATPTIPRTSRPWPCRG